MPHRLIAPSELVRYGITFRSSKYLKRLEDGGQFPRRVQVSPRKHAYVESEIIAHGETLIAKRDAG
jgi:predicted DNA-binding transcriptional regulator AlpA